MKRFFNFVADILYSLNFYIFTLLVIGATVFILYNRVTYMFSNDYLSKSQTEFNSSSNVKTDSIYTPKNAPIISIKVTIPAGVDIIDKARILHEYNVIDDQEKFLNIIRTYKLEDKVKDGEFEIIRGSTLEDVINLITDNAFSEIKE